MIGNTLTRCLAHLAVHALEGQRDEIASQDGGGLAELLGGNAPRQALRCLADL